MKCIREKILHSKVLLFLAVLLVLGLYGLRVIHLDQDLPAWGVACYQPKDEGCYAILAINEFEYGSINPQNPLSGEDGYPMLMQEHLRSNLLGNLLNITSLHLFGDNYYGLRMPMVFIGFGNLLVLGLVLLQLRKRYGQRTMVELWFILGLVFLTSIHFYFYISSRTVEPSTLRMLFAQLTLLLWLLLEKRKGVCFFLMGLCVTASVFLVYITNVFLYLAVGLLLLFLWLTEGTKIFVRSTLWFTSGSLLMFLLAGIYYRLVWSTTPIGNLLGAIGLFGGTAGYEIVGGGIMGILRMLLKGAMKYFSSFWILYAPAVLTLVLALLPGLIYQIIVGKDKTLFFLLANPVAFLLQTMVSEDYIWRKFLVIAPYFIYIIFWGILQQEWLRSLWGKWSAWCGTRKANWTKVLFLWVGRLYVPFIVGATVLMVLFHLKISNDLGKLDFTTLDKLLVLVVGCFPLLIWCGMICWKRHQKKSLSLKTSVLLLGGSTLLLSLAMLTLHVWVNPTFEERNMMISLSEDYNLDGKYVIGDYVMGLTLYNGLRYVTDSHLNYSERLIENPDLLMFHYAADSKGMREYLDTDIFPPLSAYTAQQVETIPGTFQVNGTTRDFAFYKAARREIVIQEAKDNYNKTMLEVQKELAKLEKNNQQYDVEELRQLELALKNKGNKIFDPYPGHYKDRHGDIISPIYVDTYGDIYGDIYAPVYGRIFGNVYGNIEAPVYATIFGDVYGTVHPDAVDHVDGKIHKSR